MAEAQHQANAEDGNGKALVPCRENLASAKVDIAKQPRLGEQHTNTHMIMILMSAPDYARITSTRLMNVLEKA